jgi:hypothetical protein
MVKRRKGTRSVIGKRRRKRRIRRRKRISGRGGGCGVGQKLYGERAE